MSHLKVGVRLLEVAQHVELEGGVALAAVQHHGVHAHLHLQQDMQRADGDG